MSTKPLPNPSPCRPVTPSPYHVTPRTTPILTGRIMIVTTSALALSLTACTSFVNGGQDVVARPTVTPTHTLTATQPREMLGDVIAVDPEWTPTPPATQPK